MYVLIDRRIIYIRLCSMLEVEELYPFGCILSMKQGSLLGASGGHGADLPLRGSYPVMLTR